MKYRKKPVVIEAVQWNGKNINEIKSISDRYIEEGFSGEYGHFLLIHTLEGSMRADKGDYIIKGVNGEVYPCKPDIFEKTYDFVE